MANPSSAINRRRRTRREIEAICEMLYVTVRTPPLQRLPERFNDVRQHSAET